jgi:hypothetical protein
MKYLVMVHHRVSALPAISEAEAERVVKEHEVFTAALKKAGVLVGERGLRLRPPNAMVRLEKGRGAVDGPHTETKEVVGGFYIVDVKDKAEAVEWAKRHPTWSADTVEVREIWEC